MYSARAATATTATTSSLQFCLCPSRKQLCRPCTLLGCIGALLGGSGALLGCSASLLGCSGALLCSVGGGCSASYLLLANLQSLGQRRFRNIDLDHG